MGKSSLHAGELSLTLLKSCQTLGKSFLNAGESTLTAGKFSLNEGLLRLTRGVSERSEVWKAFAGIIECRMEARDALGLGQGRSLFLRADQDGPFCGGAGGAQVEFAGSAERQAVAGGKFLNGHVEALAQDTFGDCDG